MTGRSDPRATDPDVQRALRVARGQGRPIDGVALGRIERAFGAEVGQIVIHDDERADELCRRLGADAITSATDVFFRRRAFSLEHGHGLRLVAHEAAHALQQARLETAAPSEAALLELHADALAGAALAGRQVPLRPGNPAARETGTRGGEPWIQAHGSWEHYLLGDASSQELTAIGYDATDNDQRQKIMTTIRDMLGVWQPGVAKVGAADLQAKWSGRRVLGGSGGRPLMTYGDVAALPDFVGDASSIDALSADSLNTYLQSIRQEAYNKLDGLLSHPQPPELGSLAALIAFWVATAPTDFIGAASGAYRFATMNLVLETLALDKVTPDTPLNQYAALLGRNACHFAPYSWYRWRDNFVAAQNLARQAYATPAGPAKDALVQKTWFRAGYAAHFLHDSFAAGHLVNKTLVMQWFIDWAQRTLWAPRLTLPNWAAMLDMTFDLQPGISARELYNPTPSFSAFTPGIVDPQTGQEAGTFALRLARSGVMAEGPMSAEKAYCLYLTFLANVSVQSAARAAHDHFNATSLDVASVEHSAAYALWGDDTLLEGGAGLAQTSQTAHLADASIFELLSTGTTLQTVDVLFRRFPTQARLPKSGTLVALEQWQYSQEVRDVIEGTFEDANYYAVQVGGQAIAGISADSAQCIKILLGLP